MRIGNIFLQFRDIEKMNAASYNIKGVQNENFKISVQGGSAIQSSAGKCGIMAAKFFTERQIIMKKVISIIISILLIAALAAPAVFAAG